MKHENIIKNQLVTNVLNVTKNIKLYFVQQLLQLIKCKSFKMSIKCDKFPQPDEKYRFPITTFS